MTDHPEAAGLLPCPFCGSEAYIQEDDGRFFVACVSLDCGCCYGEAWDRDAMPVHQFTTEADALAAWNARAPDEAQQARIDALAGALEPFARYAEGVGHFSGPSTPFYFSFSSSVVGDREVTEEDFKAALAALKQGEG